MDIQTERTAPDKAQLVADRLIPVVDRFLRGATVEGLRVLTGGASLQTWAFDAVVPSGRHPLILRRLPDGQACLMNSVPLATEAAAISAAGRKGVPVAPVKAVLDPEDGLGQGFVADFVAGQTVARKIQRDAGFAMLRESFAEQCGATLARIHAIEPADLPLATLTATEQLDSIERSYRSRPMRSPVFEYALRWLRDNMPPRPDRLRVVHGDFRLGNLLVDGREIRAVLDWELVHLGDPAEDLGWLTVNSWRFGGIDRPVGGIGALEPMLDAYQAMSGHRVRVEHVEYWRALGSLRWGVGAGEMAYGFAQGTDRSIERGMIGRRISETEVDLLDIIASRGFR